MICHMARRETSGRVERDFTLTYWTEDTPEEELRSAFRNKWQWVVSSPTSAATGYSTVLSNLACRYGSLEDTNIDAVRDTLTKGLKRSAFDRLKAVLDTSGEALCQVIRVPSRTLARREIFRPDESERILRVAAVFQRAIEVLGDLGKARRWFGRPKRALRGETPFKYCDTEPGAEEVTNLLGRIEHGVFS